jgi:hypothetical protein
MATEGDVFMLAVSDLTAFGRSWADFSRFPPGCASTRRQGIFAFPGLK